MYLKKLIFIFFLFSCIGQYVVAQNHIKILPTDGPVDIIDKAANVVPSERQLRWQQLELTAFIHFGINTFTNREWGTGHDNIHLFNPIHLNPDQWVREIKNAGFKQIILTAKHHDGFCLWPSKYTEHSIKNTPYKNGKGDIVREVSDACKRYGVGFGVYLSPWDRNSPYYGSKDSMAYNNYFVNQLTELLTNYGKISEVWLDGADGEKEDGKKQWYDFTRWYLLIRRLQPKAIIANMGPDARWVGTESGVGRITEWSVLPLTEASQKDIAARSQKDVLIRPGITGTYRDRDRGGRDKLKGTTGLIWFPAETDVSIRPGWFNHPAEDTRVKSGKELLELYITSVGRNGVLLLNIPPNKKGRLSEPDVKSLRSFYRLFKKTFDKNLIKKAHITFDGQPTKAKLADNNLKTCVTTRFAGDTTATIEIDARKGIRFNLIELQEAIQLGQRVERFTIFTNDQEQWVKVAEGTTIGYKRIIQLSKPVESNRIKIEINSSRQNPIIAEVGLYYGKSLSVNMGQTFSP